MIKLINVNQIQQIQNDLQKSVIITLQSLDKIVSGATARSVRGETEIDDNEATISIFAGGGMKYIVEGKPANTKMPVKKEGGKFFLLDELRYWKRLRGLQMSDYVLARTIAKNKREPIDIAGKTLEVFEKNYLPKKTNALLAYTVEEVRKEIKNGTPNN